jgi:hypothetical protein
MSIPMDNEHLTRYKRGKKQDKGCTCVYIHHPLFIVNLHVHGYGYIHVHVHVHVHVQVHVECEFTHAYAYVHSNEQ